METRTKRRVVYHTGQAENLPKQATALPE